MFKFLFGSKAAPQVKTESNRERFTRLVTELNEMIDTLPEKPKVTFDPSNGHILPETPEQFADEALALPAPDPKPSVEPAEAETDSDEAAEAPPPDAPEPATPNTEKNAAA